MVEAEAILARIAELPGGFAGSDPSRVAGWTALGATSSLELGPNGQLARLTQKDAESSVSVEYVFTPVDGATYLGRPVESSEDPGPVPTTSPSLND